MSLCRLLNAKCARCDRITQHACEAKTHPMQWPPDILETILSKSGDRNMLRARLKKRVWREVHKELHDQWFCGIGEWQGKYTRSGILGTYFFDELGTIRGGGRTKLKAPYIVVTNNEDYESELEDYWDEDTFTVLETDGHGHLLSYSYEKWHEGGAVA